MRKPLRKRIALVAGATRGSGRGIATMLGEAGATVYCTGRSTRGKSAMQNRPECIEDTADLVTKAGGKGIAIQADHSNPDDIAAVLRQIDDKEGKLDILVNDIWGGDDLTEWGQTFWQTDWDKGQLMIERGVFTHITTSRLAIPLMMKSDRAVLVEVTDGDHFGYRFNLFYDLVKTTIIRLAFAMAKDLAKTNITAVAVTPGFMRSEAVLDHFGVTEENWRDAVARDPHFAASETPQYVGRAVAGLAADLDIADKAGRVFSSWDLAFEYRFKDVDGTRPNFAEHIHRVTGTRFRKCDKRFYDEYCEQAPLGVLFPDWPPNG